MSDGLAPRRAALEAVISVLGRGRPLDESLAASRGFAGLSQRDRAFARSLSATCLRRLGEIDSLIAACLNKALPAKAADASGILRLGVCQIRYMRVPAHAAVSSSVTLAAKRAPGHKGLVNAVLRRLSREHETLAGEFDPARVNTPEWMWDSWKAAYGEDAARAIAVAHMGEPPLDLTVVSKSEQWADRLGGAVLPTGSVRLTDPGIVTELDGYEDGKWWVQDAAAALPARLLGDVAGLRVADICAAPGGKTMQLASAGATVTAVESDGGRIARLRDNLSRVGLTVDVVEADATDWTPEAPFDAVLLDAPCTATGTIRRHPEALRSRTADQAAALTDLQDRLLDAAAAITRPGGVLAFSTCSLLPEEGPDRIASFLARSGPWSRRRVEAAELGVPAEAVTQDGDLRTLPCHFADQGGMDGFYAARLVKGA